MKLVWVCGRLRPTISWDHKSAHASPLKHLQIQSGCQDLDKRLRMKYLDKYGDVY